MIHDIVGRELIIGDVIIVPQVYNSSAYLYLCVYAGSTKGGGKRYVKIQNGKPRAWVSSASFVKINMKDIVNIEPTTLKEQYDEIISYIEYKDFKDVYNG